MDEIAETDADVAALLSLISGTHFDYSETPPCGELMLGLDDEKELKKAHHRLLPPLVTGQTEQVLFWRLPNGLQLFLEVGLDRKPLEGDDLLTIFTQKYPASWHMAFSASYEFLVLQAERMKNIDVSHLAPRPENLFRPLELCPLPKVKVVIIGSGPSHEFVGSMPKATGIPFASGKSVV